MASSHTTLRLFCSLVIAVLILISILTYHYGKQNRSCTLLTNRNNKHNATKYQTNYLGPLSGYPLSKDVVIHNVHFDSRSRKGHKSMLIFFIDMKVSIFKNNLVVSCGSDHQETKNLLVRYVREDILMHYFFGNKYPYEQLILECYDVDFEDGDHGFIKYKLEKHSDILLTTSSEKPILIPGPKVKPKAPYDFTVVTCTKVYNKGAPWIPEFIRYQETIGVDHVHISILDSFIKDGGIQELMYKDRYVNHAIKRGYVTFSVWREWYSGDDVYLHSSSLQKLECLYRFRGTYDYGFPLDTDDFFNPVIPGKTNVKDYISDLCREPPAGSCAFRWVTYFPGACGLTSHDSPPDGNITAYLKSLAYHLQGNLKSAHLLEALIDASFHDAKCEGCLMDGYKVVDIPREKAYMAHLRNGQKPDKGC